MTGGTIVGMSELARCPEPGCPVRYATGSHRRCSDHAITDEGLADRLASLAGLTAAPGEGDGDSTRARSN
jgi:hypothetical protein